MSWLAQKTDAEAPRATPNDGESHEITARWGFFHGWTSDSACAEQRANDGSFSPAERDLSIVTFDASPVASILPAHVAFVHCVRARSGGVFEFVRARGHIDASGERVGFCGCVVFCTRYV